MKKLINNTGLLDKGLNVIIKNVVQSCHTCTRFKSTTKPSGWVIQTKRFQ